MLIEAVNPACHLFL